MKLVERHIINKGHQFFAECDRVCLLAKNLYNQANYRVRQRFIAGEGFTGYHALQKELQEEGQPDYTALPRKVSQAILRKLDDNWRSFFRATEAWKQAPSLFTGRPSLPKYKKHGGRWSERFTCYYNSQAVSRSQLKKGLVKPSGMDLLILTKQDNVTEVRVVPRYGYYIIEVVYEKEQPPLRQDNHRYAAIDIGLNNLASVTFNEVGIKPFIVNGRPLKAMNAYFNKKKARLMSYIGNKGTSNNIEQLSRKRRFKIDDYLHKASRYIVNQLVFRAISKLVVGKNDGWKQDINIGSSNNQSFVCVPFARFIEMLQYKCRMEGIEVILHEENHTSKCSFLDREPVRQHTVYQGKRIKRGLFRSALGRLINADTNGSYNIMIKAIPKAFADGIQGVVVHPVKAIVPS